jgi:hypothetical protein
LSGHEHNNEVTDHRSSSPLWFHLAFASWDENLRSKSTVLSISRAKRLHPARTHIEWTVRFR